MDAFVKFYWRRAWKFNVCLTLLIVWAVVDTIIDSSGLYWCYFVLIIFSVFVMLVRLDFKRDYINKLFLGDFG